MQRYIQLSVLLALCASTVNAQASPWTCNEHGAVLEMEDGIKLYLGNTCDAGRSDGAEGYWWLAASGFGVQFDGEQNGTLHRFDIACDVPTCSYPDALLPN